MMKQIELIEKRKPREKHFLREDGTILAEVYDTDIHYLKDGKYEEIDNTLVSENGVLRNKNNDYKVEFKENFRDSLMKMTKDDHYIDFKIRQSSIGNLKSEKRKISKKMQNITYNNITDDIKVEYQTLSNKVKETIVLQNANYSELNFELDTDLILSNEDGEIIAKNEKGQIIFKIEKPYMMDSNEIRNDSIHYLLNSFDDGYILTLVLDDEWLSSEKRIFPVYIDPTITNENNELSLYDTYIYPGDNNDNRNAKHYLKAGVEHINGVDRINRTLIKFTLPQIGTGSEIIDAALYVVPYVKSTSNTSSKVYLMETHQVTSDWDVNTATWNVMNDKFNNRVESVYEFERSTIVNSTLSYRTTGFDITNLVKKWYRDTPNYGIMIKSCNEEYVDDDFPMFFSTENQVSGNPKPIAAITYRNQNGLETYWDYKKQNFTDGVSYINTYNGNITSVFSLGKTIGGAIPVGLELVYNTNDVILENSTFFGKGFKLNLEQYIKEQDENRLQYIDEDGTIHYFNLGGYGFDSSQDKNSYYDEDGLGLSIVKDNLDYIMTSSNGEIKTFTKIGDIYHLTKIKDSNGNEISIILNQNNSINKITDSFDNIINITYAEDKIIINSQSEIVTLQYENDILTSINTKNGKTLFEYASTNVISGITDVTGLKINYEYYEKSPYRVKKVIQYGLNHKIGQFYTLEYGLGCTTIIDHKGRVELLAYNTNGNVVSKSNLKSINDITNAYSIKEEYNENNDIVSDVIPIRHINNLLKNTSFEVDNDYFISEDGITKNFDTEFYHSGLRSLKLQSSSNNRCIEQDVTIKKGQYYTFSAYIKSNIAAYISLSYFDSKDNEIESSETIKVSDEFERTDTTIYYDEEATSDLKIKIVLQDIGIIHVDDIQLETGEVANYYNILENSNFSQGLSGWSLSASRGEQELNPNDYIKVVSINDNNDKALRIEMNPLNSTNINKKFDIKGKKGDVYTLAFWYKYDGIVQYAPYTASNISIFYEPYNDDFGHCISSYVLPVTSENVWQYYINKEVAIEDFKSITISLFQNGDANKLYLTNLSFYKNVTSGEYNYDEKGNLISIEDQSKNSESFKYDESNKIISITNSLNNSFKYEYDKIKKDRVINMIADNGVSNKMVYNDFGNPVEMRTSKLYVKEIDGGIFRIREKGTNSFFKAELNNILLEENNCSNTLWKFEKQGDFYKISYLMNPDYVMTYRDGNIFLENSATNNLFKLLKNDDYSYSIVYEDITSNGVVSKYVVANGNLLSTKVLDGDKSGTEFYIETKESIFTEIEYTYSKDNKFINSFTDSNLNTTLYSYNQNTGLLESSTDPKGNITTYEYNDRQQLVSCDFNGRKIIYHYNNKNLISEICQGNKIFKLKYDDFLNIVETSLGEQIVFLQNNYESNNGNLISILYGNDNIINFEYDYFDRVSKITKMDNVYLYKYNNNGNISKIISNYGQTKFYYDESNRLYMYQEEQFITKYKYDCNNNIVQKKYIFDNIEHSQDMTFDSYENVIELSDDNMIINYEYDDLNRMNKKMIGSILNLKINYLTHGKRTSNMIRDFIINGSKNTYIYDQLYNITDIFNDDELQKHYEYDDFNELISEYNYDSGTHIDYSYDISGNIINKTIYDNSNNAIIKTHVYQYNNINWEDQLTCFDEENISYDAIGNPINIGTASLTWIDGNSLKSYIDEDNGILVNYAYDLNGVRLSKVVNGICTKYKTINNNIIFEKRNNDMIYYIYDIDGLIGFKYNENIYFYLKNMQDDVIGILNENGEKIVTYEYDSWGDLISVKDSNSIEITDNNHIGKINPIRYRSYYYDEETGLYYLNNRYYNPKWGRFISPDVILGSNQDIISCNLYAYVSNNPINNYDNNGTSLKSIFKKVKSVVNKVVKKVAKVVSSITSKNKNKKATKKTTKKNNNNLPNYSAELNKVLHQNALEANYYSRTLSQAAALDYFKNQVNHKQEWDYKREEIWEKEFDVPYLKNNGKFIFNGEVIDAEDFGNIHYGYVGKAMGFSDELLYMGGGYAHCGATPKILIGPYYCDDPNDHKAIKKGIEMWRKQI